MRERARRASYAKKGTTNVRVRHKARGMVDRTDARGKCWRAETYKRERRAMEGIHSHIAVQLSLIHTKSHGSKSGKTNIIGFR